MTHLSEVVRSEDVGQHIQFKALHQRCGEKDALKQHGFFEQRLTPYPQGSLPSPANFRLGVYWWGPTMQPRERTPIWVPSLTLTTDADGLRHREAGPFIELEVLS
jgi:hypothetical protein